jgi:hypothetical protein
MRGPSINVWIISLATILGGVSVLGLIQAQAQNQSEGELLSEPRPIEDPNPDGMPMDRYDAHLRIYGTTVSSRPNVGWSIRQAAEKVRDAQGGEAQASAQNKLADLLDQYFDEDMARRESELTKIEERLAKLRDLHNRRRAKKQEILDLQMKVALNEAEGLGFYDGEVQGRGGGSGFDPFAAGLVGGSGSGGFSSDTNPNSQPPASSGGSVAIPDRFTIPDDPAATPAK